MAIAIPIFPSARAQSAAQADQSTQYSPGREQIHAYIRERLGVENRMRDRLSALQDKYGDIETSCPRSSQELTSSKAIDSGRLRMQRMAEMDRELRLVFRERWDGLDRATSSARLPTTIGDHVRARNQEAYAFVLTSILKWEESDNALNAHCLDLLSLAETNLHVLSEGKESGSRQQLERKLQSLQVQVRRAEDERNKWNRTVGEADDGIYKILESALKR